MAEDEDQQRPRRPRKKASPVPTVSAKVEEDESNLAKKKSSSTAATKKRPAKKSSSKDSNASIEKDAQPKKRKHKKKSSHEEISNGQNQSEVNLLAALADPNLTAGYFSDEDTTTFNDDPAVEKVPKPRKKKKASPKTSDNSLRGEQLADSHSSLKDYFPDPALKHYLQGLHDDVESMDGEDQEYTPEFTPSPMLIPPFPPSQHSDKVFLEKDSGFRSTSHKKLTTKFPGNQIQPDLQKPTKTPLDLALESQKVFRSIGIFCHGFLAGLAFWQLIMVFILFEGAIDVRSFIELYSPLSQPLHLIFYLLTVICTISILDRYDIAKFDWRQVQKLFTIKSGGIAILIYAFTLIITLVTTKMDDKLSLYQHNSTLFDVIDDEVLESEMTTWKALNLCRSIAVIIGWLIVSMRPNTDLLYKNLRKLSDYNLQRDFKTA